MCRLLHLLAFVLPGLLIAASAFGQQEANQLKAKLFANKLIIDADKTEKKLLETLPKETVDEMLEMFSGATIQFHSDGTVEMVGGNDETEESDWSGIEVDVKKKQIKMEIDSSDVTITFKEDGSVHVNSEGITMVAKPDTVAEKQAKERQILFERLLGTWQVDQQKSNKYLDELDGVSDEMKQEAAKFYKQGLRLTFAKDYQVTLADGRKSRKYIGSLKQASQKDGKTKIDLTLTSGEWKGTLTITWLDKDSLVVKPSFGRDDDPPLILVRPPTGGSKR